jgi:hypothetical protein
MVRDLRASEAARQRAVRDAACRRAAQPGMWLEPLIAYLRGREVQYSRTFAPAILCILDGEWGPWLRPNVPPVSLVGQILIMECLKHIQDASRGAARAAKQITSLMYMIERVDITEECRNRVLVTLAVEWGKLPKRLNPREFGQLNAPLARQEFMTPLIVHLVDYFVNMFRAHDVLHVPREEAFRMTAQILYLASGGRYPDSRARVKARYLRWQERTLAARSRQHSPSS